MLRLLLVFVLTVLTKLAEGNSCAPEWFGNDCEYFCRCDGFKCDDNGECYDNASCSWLYFGPTCQYVDLTSWSSESITPMWMRDRDDSTCNPDPSAQRIHVQLDKAYPLSWIRVRLNQPGLQDSLVVTSVGQLETPRSDFIRIQPDALTLDLYSRRPDFVTGVFVEGPGLRALCNVFVSGDRLISLNQKTNKSSTIIVDRLHSGGTRGCFLTAPDDTEPTFNMTFSQPRKVNRYIIVGSHRQELREVTRLRFSLYDNDDNLIHQQWGDLNRNKFLYGTFLNTSFPVSKVSITTETDDGPAPLAACDVLIYGDSICEVGKYGRECELTCNCADKNEACFVSTGACQSGCAEGFRGKDCQVPIFCDGPLTSRVNGICLRRMEKALNWKQAQAACEALGPTVTLIELTSDAIRSYVQEYTQERSTSTWVGATDIVSEGNYVWSSTGNKADIVPSWWSEGQPDNYYGNEDCLMMKPNGFLNDYNCNWSLPYFCQASY